MIAAPRHTQYPSANARILVSSETDPRTNLAIEEALFRTATADRTTLLLYTNSPAIILGRNQNPWQECDIEWAREKQVPIVRRISGGGTVYHDPGNLNISFIVPRKAYAPDRLMGLAAAALNHLHIPARLCERRTIWVGGRKVAGSAFTLSGKAAVLHQCLLIDTDLHNLSRALEVPPKHITGKSVQSIPSPVCNLTQIKPDITTDEVADAVEHEIAQLWKITSRQTVAAPDIPGNQQCALREKYASWAWNFARTAQFEHVVTTEGNWRLHLTVVGAGLSRAVIHPPNQTPITIPHCRDVDYDGRAIANKIVEIWPETGNAPRHVRNQILAQIHAEIPSGLREDYPWNKPPG